MNTITPIMPSRIRTTHPIAPCGAGPFLPFGRTGLNLAISAMVASRLMKPLRTAVVLAAAVLAGCARTTPMPDAFPETLGAWHRNGPPRDLSTSQPPDSLPGARIEQIRTASYQGPGKVEARAYALPSPAVALDVVQRWTPHPDTVFFYHGRFFVVVHWQNAEKKELQAFVGALEKQFTKQD